MNFRAYDHPNAGPCLHVLDNTGRVVLELPQLTKDAFGPHPPLGYEVWSYAGDDDQLGTVTYHATEEQAVDSRPWCFQVYTDRYRLPRVEGAKSWHATMPDAIADAWTRGLELLDASDKQTQIMEAFDRR